MGLVVTCHGGLRNAGTLRSVFNPQGETCLLPAALTGKSSARRRSPGPGPWQGLSRHELSGDRPPAGSGGFQICCPATSSLPLVAFHSLPSQKDPLPVRRASRARATTVTTPGSPSSGGGGRGWPSGTPCSFRRSLHRKNGASALVLTPGTAARTATERTRERGVLRAAPSSSVNCYDLVVILLPEFST